MDPDHEQTSGEMLGSMSLAHEGVYFPSLSARTFVYKGMLVVPQLSQFYPDLLDERLSSGLALVHSRFSTNTFPSWPLAHPYRMIVHNGEINTVQGNQNWMRAREALLASEHFGDGALESIFPICTPGASDTARFDECLEMLCLAGYSLPEAVLMMIPEPWENHESMAPELKAFYRYNASRMEPWDGPASIAFTDGTVIGAVLDRNGLRPSRYWVTDEDLVVMASEVGVLDVAPDRVIEKGRLQPGRMFLVDTSQGRIVRDHEIKHDLATARPYGTWLEENQIRLADLSEVSASRSAAEPLLRRRQLTFGYTHEELRILVAPMARDGKEALGSMGTDTPVAVLSKRSRLLFDYFQQLFAQVTNPPLDAIREEIITSVYGWLGPEGNLLDPQPESCRQILIDHPVLTNEQLARLVDIDHVNAAFRTAVIDCLYPVAEGGPGLRSALDRIRAEVSEAIDSGVNLVVLSDRFSDETLAPVPSLLAVGAVHQHLVRERKRTQVGLIVESGDAREVHHMCLLLGYGATAINPYLALESIADLIAQGAHGLSPDSDVAEAHRNYIKACDKGILKVLSKMGISTVRSYIGAQIFEAVGLGHRLVMDCFTRHHQPARGDRLLPPGPGGGAAPSPGLRAQRGRASPPRPRTGRRVSVAPRGRVPPVQPRDGLQAAARHAGGSLRHLPAVFGIGRRAVPEPGNTAGTLQAADRGSRTGAARGGGAGQRDREAVRHRRHVLRLDLCRGARDPGHRHEPHRRQVQHR